jgi:hypothetical protein
MVYTSEEYRKLIEQSGRKGKFSVAMCNDNFSTEHKRWWSKFYKNNTMSVQSYGKPIPRAQNVNSSISQYQICEYSSQTPGEISTADFIDGLNTNNLRLLSVPKNTRPAKRKAFPKGMCPINVKKM